VRNETILYTFLRPSWGLLLLLLLQGCYVAQPARYRVRIDPGARSFYRHGLQASWWGHTEVAEDFFRRALQRDPGFVAAHRSLQNLKLERGERGTLLRNYRERLAQRPQDAASHYLLGRLYTDRHRQREAFETAHELDPSLPWSYLGLGHIALERGDDVGAFRAFHNGLRCQPQHRELQLGLAALFLRKGNLDEAAVLLQESSGLREQDEERLILWAELELARDRARHAIRSLTDAVADAPDHSRLARTLLSLLRSHGKYADAREVLRRLGSQHREGRENLARVLFLAAQKLGDDLQALQVLQGVTHLSAAERAERRRILFRQGLLREALDHEEVRFAAMEELGFASDTMRALRRETHSFVEQSSPTSHDAVELARCCRDLGWLAEAQSVLRLARLRGVRRDPTFRLLEEELQQQQQLEAELDAVARRTYWEFDQRGIVKPLEDFLQELAHRTQRIVGQDLVAAAPLISVWPVGSMLDPDPASGSSFARYFTNRGRLVVVGQRQSRPPEIMLLPALGTGRAGPQQAYLVLAEGVQVPSYLQHRGALLSGAALDRFMYVDLAAIEDDLAAFQLRLKLVGDPRRLLQEPLEPVEDSAELLSLREPLEVTLRLRLRALREDQERRGEEDQAGFLAAAADAVLRHEEVHLEDAHHLLRSGWHLIRYIPELLARRLSAHRIEAWIEMRAQCGALARAQSPHWVLANCTGYLPVRGSGATPHADGYRELLQRMVSLIDRHPQRFHGIRRDRNLLQQLDRLEVEEIRWIAAKIAEQIDIELSREAPVAVLALARQE
jgi:tetratricopeptide (TPR) repeat protein